MEELSVKIYIIKEQKGKILQLEFIMQQLHIQNGKQKKFRTIRNK
ncbi:MAG: hypothetical protein CM15mV127_180 [Caudoviricetes sp.]|nr:MAG: hypothetical protein CM15mV127_180 [Caudoviricetes sp.]